MRRVKERHRYINLLYKYRSKLSHEMKHSSQSGVLKNLEHIVYYHSSSSCYIDNAWHRSEWWNMSFPYKYLREIFKGTIFAYLDDCENQSKHPFENDGARLEKYKTWEY